MIWNILSEFTSGAKEDPATCGFAFHMDGAKTPLLESYPEQWVALVAIREGGGDDVRTPRRVLAVGSTRTAARRSLTHILSRYDHRPTVVYPSERASDEDA